MKKAKFIFLILVISCFTFSWSEAKKHASTEIIPIYKTSVESNKLLLAVKFIIDKDWHIYWRNSGDSGLPTYIKLVLPEGISHSDFFWPTPELIKTDGIADYAYEDSVYIFTEISYGNLEELKITSYSDYLVCNDICIPEKDTAHTVINLNDGNIPDSKPVISNNFLNSLPDTSRKVKGIVYKTKNYYDLSLPLNLVNISIEKQFNFFPYEPGIIEHSGFQMHKFLKDELRIIIPKAQIPLSDPEYLEGILVFKDVNGNPKSIYLKSQIHDKGGKYEK